MDPMGKDFIKIQWFNGLSVDLMTPITNLITFQKSNVRLQPFKKDHRKVDHIPHTLTQMPRWSLLLSESSPFGGCPQQKEHMKNWWIIPGIVSG